MREVLSVDEVAQILNTTPASLRQLMSAGRDVPPSFRIGRRRVFLRRVVYDWLARKSGLCGRGRSRGVPMSTQKEGSTMSELFEVAEGNVLLNEDSGEELTVVKLYPARGYAVLEDSAGDEQAMSIERLLDAVEDGELVRVEDDPGVDEDEEQKPGESDVPMET